MLLLEYVNYYWEIFLKFLKLIYCINPMQVYIEKEICMLHAYYIIIYYQTYCSTAIVTLSIVCPHGHEMYLIGHGKFDIALLSKQFEWHTYIQRQINKSRRWWVGISHLVSNYQFYHSAFNILFIHKRKIYYLKLVYSRSNRVDMTTILN